MGVLGEDILVSDLAWAALTPTVRGNARAAVKLADFGDPEIATRVSQYEMAYRMQDSVPEVTDLSDEPEYILNMYGPQVHQPGTFARNCLLARRLIQSGVPVWLSIIITLLIGVGIGIFHGFGIVRMGLPPFIITLATLNQNSEVVAMKAAGLSAHQVLAPLLLTAGAISVVSFAFNEAGELFGSTANGCPSVFMPIPNRYYEAVKGWSSSVLRNIAPDNHFEPITEKEFVAVIGAVYVW